MQKLKLIFLFLLFISFIFISFILFDTSILVRIVSKPLTPSLNADVVKCVHLQNFDSSSPYFNGDLASFDDITVDDRISPIDMKMVADFHYGSLPVPEEFTGKLRKLTPEYYRCLQDGVVIFVDSSDVYDFIIRVLPLFSAKIVLISGDSDATVPPLLLLPRLRELLSDGGSIIHWFSMNCGYNANPAKFSCIPNGISQWRHDRRFMQASYKGGIGLLNGISQNLKLEKDETYWMLASFSVTSNEVERKPVWNLGCSTKSFFKNITKCLFDRTMPVSETYKIFSRSKFVLSPPGNGLDCYRTYEALYLGSYPIVKSSTLDEIFEGLPVLIVKDWNDISLDLLEKTYDQFRKSTFDFSKLYKGYWFNIYRSFGYKKYIYKLVE